MGSIRFNPQRQAWFIDYIDATGRRMRQTIGVGDSLGYLKPVQGISNSTDPKDRQIGRVSPILSR